MVIILLAALIDELGKFHWFWPYDRTVFSVAILISALWYMFFGPQLRAWAGDDQAKLDREDESP